MPDVHFVAGRVSTIPPGAHGGNIDNWRIGAGAVMYYPVQVAGGLFSIGDPHVSQGDGEISGTAIESSLNVLFQIVLRRDGVDTEFAHLSAARAAVNKTIVHPEKLTRSKADHATTKGGGKK